MTLDVMPQKGGGSHGCVNKCYHNFRTSTVYAPCPGFLSSRSNACFFRSSSLKDIFGWWNGLVVDTTVIIGTKHYTESRLISRDLVAMTC